MNKQVFFSCFLALSALAFPACENTVLDPSTHVEGVVADASTGAPLDSVRVVLYEDNDGPLMGNHPIKEMTTDKSGRYQFTFEWQEEPYTIKVTRRDYKYLRIEESKLSNGSLVFDYQSLEPLKKRQTQNFDMEALGTLEVQLKNNAPASPSDVLLLKIDQVDRQNLPRGPQAFTGEGDHTLPVFSVGGNRYVRFLYSVTQAGIRRDFKDSLFVRPFQKNVYILSY